HELTPSRRRRRTEIGGGISMRSARLVVGGVVAGAVVALALALAVAAFLFQSDTTAAAPAMEGMNMTSGAAYWQSVGGGAFPRAGGSRAYYISADKVVWDYAPDGRNEITGKPFD